MPVPEQVEESLRALHAAGEMVSDRTQQTILRPMQQTVLKPMHTALQQGFTKLKRSEGKYVLQVVFAYVRVFQRRYTALHF